MNDQDEKYVAETVGHLIDDYGIVELLCAAVEKFHDRSRFCEKLKEKGFNLDWSVEINEEYVRILNEAIDKMGADWE